ncbi:FAD-binding oxidoreductase [Chloroflexota bacterium]
MVAEGAKVVPQKLSREAYHALESVVGKEWVTEDRAMIEAYVVNTDDAGASLRVLNRDTKMRAAAVVMASSTEEVQGVVRVANRYGFPIVTVGNMQLASAPALSGTVMLSLRRMDKIQVDEENMRITIQPFIDYGKVHHEGAKRGLWLGGSGWHGAIAKPCSQYVTYGLWQSDLKYSGLARSTVGLTMVLADGSILKLGSSAIGGTDEIPFTERFPGPNIMGMIKGSFGGCRGIVTDITLKLSPWVGGHPFPEDRGRPSIEHFFEDSKEKKFDRAPTHPGHKIFWFDLESLSEGMLKLSRSGVGIAVNACGDFNASMCSYTIAEANERSKGYFHISGYIVIAAFTSPKQLDYEEKVVRHIVDETGGKLWSEDYKPEMLDAVSPWNVEYILNVETGMRTIRSNYISQILPPYSNFEQPAHTAEIWRDLCKEYGIPGEERGEYHSRMPGECPYCYVGDRGHQMMTELDQFPERTSKEELITWINSLVYLQLALMEKGYPFLFCVDVGEPWVSTFPEIGPDSYMIMRIMQKIINPKGVIAPRRAVLTGEEFKETFKKPGTIIRQIMEMRERFGLPKLEPTPEGDRWQPVK